MSESCPIYRVKILAFTLLWTTPNASTHGITHQKKKKNYPPLLFNLELCRSEYTI